MMTYGICALGALLAILVIFGVALYRAGKKVGDRQGWARAMGPMKGVVMMALEDEE